MGDVKRGVSSYRSGGAGGGAGSGPSGGGAGGGRGTFSNIISETLKKIQFTDDE